MAGFVFDRRTREERAADHQEWIDKHYLEEGKRYTFETNRYWVGGYGFFGGKIMEWTAYIKLADCPWSTVACYGGFKHETSAANWAREYLKRGGPPSGFFDPPPPDPNAVTYRGAA